MAGIFSQTRVVLGSAALVAACAGHANGQCAQWDDQFGVAGPTHTLVRPIVRTYAECDHGSGPVLYAGGTFSEMDGVAGTGVVAMSADGGSTWASLGTGLAESTGNGFNRGAWTSAVFNGHVYFGGWVAGGGNSNNRLVRWNGSAWVAMPNLTAQAFSTDWGPLSMITWDDGNGEALYVAGEFNGASSPNVTLNAIGRWDGLGFTALGTGTAVGVAGTGSAGRWVQAMAVFQNKLYIGGRFNTAGGTTVPARRIASWNGTTWAVLPGGELDGEVTSMVTFNDGSGEALYVVGLFTESEPVTLNGVGRFDGTGWSAMGAGFAGNTPRSIAAYDDGTGPALYVGGDFPGGLVRWSGSAWVNTFGVVGGGTPPTEVRTLKAIGNALYVGGHFTDAGGLTSNHMARFACTGSEPCYANCDESTIAPVLNVSDFTCFLQRFAAGEAYANCDESTIAPVLNVSDFTCFLQRFAAGCP